MNIKLNDNEFSKIISKGGDIKEYVGFKTIDGLIISFFINPEQENEVRRWVMIMPKEKKTNYFVEGISGTIAYTINKHYRKVKRIDIYLVSITLENGERYSFADIPVSEFNNLIISYYTKKNGTSGGKGVVNVEKKDIIN